MNTFMKSLIYTAILLLFLPSCVVIRAIRYGNASVDDYSVFEQEIVAKGSDPYHFTEKQNVLTLADTLKYEIYLSKTDTLLNVTLKEAMDYINVPSAAIVIQNDTVIFEHYSGGWDRNSQSCVFSVTKTVTSLLCGIVLKEGYIKSVNDPVTKVKTFHMIQPLLQYLDWLSKELPGSHIPGIFQRRCGNRLAWSRMPL